MALEKTFRNLPTHLRHLRDRLEELEVTVVNDRPRKNDAAIVDRFEYAVDDLRGWVEEALRDGEEAEKAVTYPADIDRARRSLTRCQEHFQLVDKEFAANLVSYERMTDLTSFGSERRNEWPSWVTSVKQGIEHCRGPIEETRKALAGCWEEIAERVGMTSISVQATNIGQKIITSGRASEAQDVERTT